MCFFIHPGMIKTGFSKWRHKKKSLWCNKSLMYCTVHDLLIPPLFPPFIFSSSPARLWPFVVLLPSCLCSLWEVFSCCPYLRRSQQRWRTSMLYWASCTLQTNTLELRETERHSGKKKIKIKGKKNTAREGLFFFLKQDTRERRKSWWVCCAVCTVW